MCEFRFYVFFFCLFFRLVSNAAISLRVTVVNVEAKEFDDTFAIRASLWNSVKEFKDELYQHFNHDASVNSVLIMLEVKGDSAKFIDDDKLLLKDCGELPSSKVS